MALPDKNFWHQAWEKHIAANRRYHDYFLQASTWDMMAADYKVEVQNEAELASTIISRFDLPPGTHIIDLGCGPGNLSLPLLAMGYQVTAIDISKKMLERLLHAVPDPHRERLQIIQLDWQADTKIPNLPPAGLVIAHMTPAVNSPEALDKMLKLPGEHYFYASWAGARQSLPYDEIAHHLLPKNSDEGGQHLFFAFNYLLSLGHYPRLSYRDHSWQKQLSIDAAVHSFCQRLQLTRPEITQDVVRQMLLPLLREGKIQLDNSGRIGEVYF
jgi:SAM-dependent methyltransferase